MSTVTVILKPAANGMLHLPVPEELRSVRVKVTATLEPADPPDPAAAPPRPDFAAIRQRLWGSDAQTLSPDESAYIRDRGDRWASTPTPA